MGITVVDAARLIQTNKRAEEELRDRESQLAGRTAAEVSAQEQARRELFTEGLLPFQELFGRLKAVDVAELAAIDLQCGVDLRKPAPSAVRAGVGHALGAVAGGAVAGTAVAAGASAATITTVGALATASTGTAISGLSGAAATNATLAWLGGGSIAAGGGGVAAGTAVLAGIAAAPALLAFGGVVAWQARRVRRHQQGRADELTNDAARLDQAERTGRAVRRLSRQVRDILKDLRRAITCRLPVLAALLDTTDDYPAMTVDQRHSISILVAIATTAVTVMSTAITTEDGEPSAQCRRAVLDARQQLNALGHPG
ncbi:hypothetical protein [Frankia sp. AgB32]|uniref:hypothetical protein n=1 Tax=Frankia sp. AgB32 TaxID=631119 RepID=UPI00200ED00E|nr:hypothetical protein [Frankia sp. AgB32]MCK9893607.1 hypothetical protein [Frankia sp. AgB32]